MSCFANKVILLRHAESEKNLKHIHGGKGERLTEHGVFQAKKIAEYIEEIVDVNNLLIMTSTSVHTQATAKIIGEILDVEVCAPVNFVPLNLGVADGKSEKELEEEYPEVSLLLDEWRKRKIDIKRLKIPQMESYIDFWQRGKNLINLLPKNHDVVMVCSNSLMILLGNIMLNNHPILTDNYKHISIQNCGILAFETINYEVFNFLPDNSTVKIDF